MTEKVDNKTDAAALGGGVVAIAMTMFVEEGPYDEIGIAVGLTLWILILGYLGTHRRGRFQSLALAAVLAVLSIPILGYFAEIPPALWGPEAPKRLWADVEAMERWRLWAEGASPFEAERYRPSSVSAPAVFLTWLLLTAILFIVDRDWQRMGRRRWARLRWRVARRLGEKRTAVLLGARRAPE